ncbi:hypothetical protein [Pseudoxanthomonas sp. CF125]|uniref:hypothetical protein n=1 Tax=Pseudoxanthomonas sp. CF125 TaxID=1855303 RepID=UPI00088FDABC|nr:hypothetical protein [Pseudoxanthomonas sp. CF125]SDQ43476.1 hypothetical protein SAMN05216569_1111 [Pseudoxanthomonas sp. CF125]
MTTPLVQQIETWLGTFGDDIPPMAYRKMVAIQTAAAEALAGRAEPVVPHPLETNHVVSQISANLIDNGPRRQLQELIDRYWDLAYAEGKEGRDYDTEEGDAALCRYEIEKALRELATPSRAGGGEVGAIETAPFYYERGGGAKQDAATGYCNGWNDCVAANRRKI